MSKLHLNVGKTMQLMVFLISCLHSKRRFSIWLLKVRILGLNVGLNVSSMFFSVLWICLNVVKIKSD